MQAVPSNFVRFSSASFIIHVFAECLRLRFYTVTDYISKICDNQILLRNVYIKNLLFQKDIFIL